ncbi:putative FAD dependent oxidoreductase [Cadophora sp. DSE1049]|nr:putative FAD dependent oxidoreductase [Cadophora sp. DSE1049]
MGLLENVLFAPGVTDDQRQAATNRMNSDPGVPDSRKTTQPFWLEDASPISNVRSEGLQEEVDIVIIGSGITAASVARELLKGGHASTPKIAVLDARDICSGATGRNGGHINEAGFDVYSNVAEVLGKDIAAKVTRFRLGHLPLLLEIAREEQLLEETQIRTVESVFAFFDSTRFLEAKAALALFKADMPLESKDHRIFEAEDARKKFLLPDICGAITYPAGAVWPYKLVAGIFHRILESHGGNIWLESNTPVNAILRPDDDNSKFTIVTPRGNIKATHVVHCTNAHAGHLIPGLRGHIVPLRGHMSAQVPGKSFPDQSHRSWSFIYAKGFDYLTQLLPNYPSSSPLCAGSELMMGGGFAQGLGGGIEDFGVATDSRPFDFHTKVHLSGILRAAFAEEKWGEEDSKPIKSMWTGNMGFTHDSLPLVGKLHSSLTGRNLHPKSIGSEWIAAGFNGEGMVHAWRSGVAVAQMMLEDLAPNSSYGWQEWFPDQLLVTEERLKMSAPSQ